MIFTCKDCRESYDTKLPHEKFALKIHESLCSKCFYNFCDSTLDLQNYRRQVEQVVKRHKSNRIGDDFVEMWNNADSVEEVAKAFGINNRSASTKATGMRVKGIEMKKFK